MNTTSVSVFGTLFMDCKGFAHNNYQPETKNLGSVQFVHGGVGRNVAENLSQLGIQTAMITGSDKTAMGKEITDHLLSLGVTLPYMKFRESQVIGIWLAIINEHGELSGSISQMPDLTLMESIIDEHGSSIIENSDHIVLVLDLNHSITTKILRLAHELNKPVYGIPANLSVVTNHPEILHGLSCFICNNYEMDLFTSSEFSTASLEEQQSMLKEFVHQVELHSMIVTLGQQGSISYDAASGEIGHQPVFPVELVDSSGAGDAFFSGAIAAFVKGASATEASLCGNRVASWTITQKESICPDLKQKINADQQMWILLGND